MAQLPSGEWLMQQQSGIVMLFHRYTEEVIVRFDPSEAEMVAQVQKTIYDDSRLNPEDKCFAFFWAGYFYAHATRNPNC